MDRLFLDANVLFSAAYSAHSGLKELWKLSNVKLCSSHYALEEARINLADETQRQRLNKLAGDLELLDTPSGDLPQGILLPPKDVPIMLAAIAGSATYLLTGDIRHFGKYFGKKVCGIIVLAPGDYLRKVSKSVVQ